MFSSGLFRFPGDSGGPFIETYRCFPISFLQGKADKEHGDKIILPPSSFERLARMTVTYPMQFELRNESLDIVRRTHVGVLEFTAEEGRAYVPFWIMQNLLMPEGAYVEVRNVTLPIARFVKFRPRSVDFLDLSNPKAVLESTLRNFSCLTLEDQICLQYGGKNYFVDVVALEPADAVSIIEADVRVDFEPPVGYVDPSIKHKEGLEAAKKQQQAVVDLTDEDAAPSSSSSKGKESNIASGVAPSTLMQELAKAREERRKQSLAEKATYTAFSGEGRRVDGKTPPNAPATTSAAPRADASASVPAVGSGKWKQRTKGMAFQGEGKSLR